jgi:hypothetical protein
MPDLRQQQKEARSGVQKTKVVHLSVQQAANEILPGEDTESSLPVLLLTD